MVNPIEFSELLRAGILSIQRYESRPQAKKPLKAIHTELASAIGISASMIDYYLKGHVPVSFDEIAQLARVIFTRGQLDGSWLEKFLESGGYPNPAGLCNELLVPNEEMHGPFSAVQYKQRRMHIERELFLDEALLKSRTEVEIEVTADSPLQSVRYDYTPDDVEQRAPVYLQFEPNNHDRTASVTPQIMRNDRHRLLWRVEFKPPLVKGQSASYAYSQTSRYVALLTYESCYENYRRGKIQGFFTSCSFLMPVPTDELSIKYTFPPNYHITLPDSGGFAASLGFSENLEEKTRIIANNGFSANFDQAARRWSLELKVHHAKMGLNYELRWIPPRATPLTPHQKDT